MNLALIKTVITSKVGRGILLAKKHSPTAMVVGGTIGLVATVVLASKETLNLESIVDTAKADLDRVNDAVEKETYVELNGEKVLYNEELATQDKFRIYCKTAVALAKNYAPAIIVGSISVACILGGYHILNTRHVALVAAYNGLAESFTKYRNYIKKNYGADTDKNAILGVGKTLIEKEFDGGVVEEEVPTTDDDAPFSPYAAIFDESSNAWEKSSDYNFYFLKVQETHANDLLRSRGHIFLNEVYDMLGLPRTKAGQIVGWVKDTKVGDGFVDFGLPTVTNGERSFLLDFNVDGPIYDLI